MIGWLKRLFAWIASLLQEKEGQHVHILLRRGLDNDQPSAPLETVLEQANGDCDQRRNAAYHSNVAQELPSTFRYDGTCCGKKDSKRVQSTSLQILESALSSKAKWNPCPKQVGVERERELLMAAPR